MGKRSEAAGTRQGCRVEKEQGRIELSRGARDKAGTRQGCRVEKEQGRIEWSRGARDKAGL